MGTEREQSIPSKPVAMRKRYARLPRHDQLDETMTWWTDECSVNYALMCLDAELRRGGHLVIGTWRGHHYAALLAHDARDRPGPNAVSSWSGPSPRTCLLRLAFKWSEVMRHSWEPEMWGIPNVDFDCRMPIGGPDLWVE